MPAERILNVHWDGPVRWEQRHELAKNGHVLYAIYGAHYQYGLNRLLYLGKSNQDIITARLERHDKEWVQYESDVSLRLASIGEFSGWEPWTTRNIYPPPNDGSLVDAAEALLIFAHQPPYNTQRMVSLEAAKDYRLFNTGQLGLLLPEISYSYLNG